ncbi:oligosaccharide flippase family protein [candidate division WWE3 bacterium]|nr:oligosaccharide flippase family protein [candidate division WWE3 bacterium]
MKSLVKLQVYSFISRMSAMLLGMIQTFVIVRVLTVSEWGVVQLAASIGGAFGIYQHLGLSSGSTREISAAKDDEDVFKIFLTGLIIRYLVTIPIALFLFFSANNLALNKYSNAALILPIKLYALVLIVESAQSILNSVISGTKRFKQLFIYQSLIALISVCIYIPLVYFFKVNGYFYALALFNLIGTLTLTVVAFKPYLGKISLPSKEDFVRLFKELLSISLAIYVVKIIYTWWEKSGALLLGLDLSSEMVAFFSFALLYGKKLMLISDSATTVNLPVLSEKFTENLYEFKELFVNNFNKLYVFILGAGFAAVFWAREIFYVLVGGNKYDSSLPLVLPLVFAFVFYSLINIIKSSIVIPAKKVFIMIASFVIMIVVTVGGFFLFGDKLDPLIAMAYFVALGSFSGLLFMSFAGSFKLQFNILGWKHFVLLVQVLGMSLSFLLQNVWLKVILFIVFVWLYWWAVTLTGFLTKEHVFIAKELVLSKLGELRARFRRVEGEI